MSWTRRRGRVLLWIGLVAVVAGLLVLGLAGRGGADRRAPALPGEALAGAPPATLASLLGGRRGGHAGLVLFWASWCEPCRQEAPAVERFALSPAGRGRLVGVDYGESERGAPSAFLHRYHWTFPVLRDPGGRAGEAYGVANLPSTFVIDAAGRIRATLRGPQTAQSLGRALAAASG